MAKRRAESVTGEAYEIRLVYEVSSLLAESASLESVLSPVLDKIAFHLDILRGFITIYNRKTGEIAIEEAWGLDSEEVSRGRYRPGEGITGEVIETGRPVVVPRVSEEPRFLDRTGSRRKADKSDISFVCVPIGIQGETVGTIGIDLAYDRSADLDSFARVLGTIASTISLAVRYRQAAQEEVEALKRENDRLHAELESRWKPESVIGNSKIMRLLYREMEQVSATNATVLILGESGVGKERIAHAIHYGSPRAGKPFVKLNCAAIPESLIESELFGHEKGAFTNATARRCGRFEMADCGTIFLDEIGEMPLAVQSKFLRVLQEREFERIGGTETIRVNIRVIAATNRNLPALIREGRFREDLWYRLNVFPLVVPPLRERKTDVMLLANHFIEKYTREHAKRIKNVSPQAVELLMGYDWPGNVRELENCVERAVILSVDETIHAYHLPPSLQRQPASVAGKGETLEETMAAIERGIIAEELERQGGNVARTAERLGVTERILGLRVAKYGLKGKGGSKHVDG
jgi:Nif-specific regulatory protein